MNNFEGPRGPGEHERQRQRERRPFEERLEQFEALLEGATESLRARWAEELVYVHGVHLELGHVDQALRLEERIAEELRWRPATLRSEFVRRQHVAWAQVGLDAAEHRARRAEPAEVERRIPQLLQQAERVVGDDVGAAVLARALALAHRVARSQGDHPAARGYVRRLCALESSISDEAIGVALAQARALAVRAELEIGRVGRAREVLGQLRSQANEPMACEPERSALAEALLSWHGHAEGDEQAQVEQELGELASRVGAAQDQRRAWALALEEADRQGRRCVDAPLELLRQRAYRGSATDDLEALFEHLEEEIPYCSGPLVELMGLMGELRHIAERPEASERLRVRFARHWLERNVDARRLDYGAVANDRCAYRWARASAERGELEGQVLLGRCLAYGRGIDRDRTAALPLLREAMGRGSDEAQMLLRTLWVERAPWLQHRFVLFMCFGWAMLLAYVLAEPFHFDPWGVVAALVLAIVPVRVFAFLAGLGSRLGWNADEEADEADEQGDHRSDYVFRRQVAWFTHEPWKILGVIYEDGAVLVPLVWLGINPLTAVGAGLVFGLMHYPQYTLRTCLTIAAKYAAVALFVVPWAGVWPVAVAHVLYDVWVLRSGSR